MHNYIKVTSQDKGRTKSSEQDGESSIFNKYGVEGGLVCNPIQNGVKGILPHGMSPKGGPA